MSALLAMMLAQAALSPACSAICDAGRLHAAFEKLARSRTSREPIRIIQIGDSHTAGDQLTGAWRSLLQARFGLAGRGPMVPGRPYQGYLSRDVTVTQSPGWSVAGVFGPNYRTNDPRRIGATGYTLTGSAGEWLGLTADRPDAWFDSFSVCGYADGPEGSITIASGQSIQTIRLESGTGARSTQTCRTLPFPAREDAVRLTVSGGPVTLTSWSTDTAGRGVELSNFGTVGSQFVHWSTRTDDRLVATELAFYRPDLIVLAFGTNEAFAPNFSSSRYEAGLRSGLDRVHRLAPGVPIMMLGAPDSATRSAALQMGIGMDGVTPLPSACIDDMAAIPQAAGGRDGLEAGQASASSIGNGGVGRPSWGPTAALATVQAIQRRVAHEMGAAFWDWSSRMGGRCSAETWAGQTPALMRGDHVHFTTPGANEIGRRLEADFEAAMVLDGTSAAIDDGSR